MGESIIYQSETRFVQKSSAYNKILIGFIFINVVTYGVMIFFNIAAGQDIGIFGSTTGDVSRNATVNITPAGITFSTWGAIYAWNALWLLLNVILIFCKNNDERLYTQPPVLTIPFHVCIFANFILNISWLFLWDISEFTWSLVIIVFMVITLYAAIIIATRNTYHAVSALQNKKWVYWLYRILALNGLTFYAAWITVATLLNLAIAITYKWAPSSMEDDYRSTSSIISLCILAVLLLVYFTLDVYFFEKYTRYTWSAYLQLTIAFAGILGENWDGGKEPSSVLALCLAIIVVVMFILKIFVTIFKHCTNKRE